LGTASGSNLKRGFIDRLGEVFERLMVPVQAPEHVAWGVYVEKSAQKVANRPKRRTMVPFSSSKKEFYVKDTQR
jgi:hypothetical protein